DYTPSTCAPNRLVRSRFSVCTRNERALRSDCHSNVTDAWGSRFGPVEPAAGIIANTGVTCSFGALGEAGSENDSDRRKCGAAPGPATPGAARSDRHRNYGVRHGVCRGVG